MAKHIYRMAHKRLSYRQIAFYATLWAGALLVVILALSWAWGG